LTIVDALNCNRSLNTVFAKIETHAVSSLVRFGLSAVPFEFQFRITTGNQ
jgi:hypothetical protein